MINFHNIDCMEFMQGLPDKAYDLAIVDIPYGLGNKLTQGGTWANKYSSNDSNWDILPTADYFTELFRVSKNQIIWGGNYAHKFLTSNRCFLIWDKLSHIPTMSDCEYAWTSFDSNAKIFKHPRNTSEKRIHITQKPVALYKWLLDKYAKPGDKILDTHGGSGSIAIACHDYKFDLDICELDKEYFDAMVKRYNQHAAQLTLF
jgi:site-specific DNA-methyltransferase (adenine-specific)